MSTPGRADPVYRALRKLGRFWLWFLYGAIDVRGAERVPPTGPVLLCINHPNNLIDSLVVGAVLSRQIHYLVTATLFRHALLARLLARAGAIPVSRRRDATEGPERNADAFAACRAVLAAGGVVGIYPEGTTHGEPRVQRIRTGAARIALDLGREDLAVIPVGLLFGARKAFREPVRVTFGEPVPLGPPMAAARLDRPRAVTELTADIQAAMERQALHVEDREVAGLAAQVEALYRDDLVHQIRAERGLPPEAVDLLRLSRTIADAVTHFQARDPGRVACLAHRMRRYQAELAACHLRDAAVRGRLPEPPESPGGHARSLAILPVFLYGAVTNAAPYALTRWIARRWSRQETDYATIRLLASVVAFPVAWGLETWLVARQAGPGPAVLFALSLPLTGLLAHRYWRGLGRLEGRVRFAWLAATRARAASRLLSERRAILGELGRARADYLAATGRATPLGSSR